VAQRPIALSQGTDSRLSSPPAAGSASAEPLLDQQAVLLSTDSVTQGSARMADGMTAVLHQEDLLRTRALQNAILTAPVLDHRHRREGIIQLFNVGASGCWAIPRAKS